MFAVILACLVLIAVTTVIPSEALHGRLLIGGSASYDHIAMERFWGHCTGDPQS